MFEIDNTAFLNDTSAARKREIKEAQQAEKYRIKGSTVRSGKQVNLIEPKEGDYMVSTLSHYNSLKYAGYRLNGDMVPHDRMDVMHICEYGLSQCGWGSPAQTEGRAIHSIWPGEWELGLTPLDSVNDTQIFDRLEL